MTKAQRPVRTAAGAALALALALSGATAAAQGSCSDAVVELRGPSGKASFRVDVADNVEERAKGLMFVTKMPLMSGMLFVYEIEQPVSFWMKNTLIPLDMIFMDATGRVVRVHENARPHDLTAIPSLDPARFVLEVNAGIAKKLRIDVGSEMRHPAVAQDLAAWPCD